MAADLDARRRAEMVDRHVAGRGVRARRVLDALRSVPREDFAPPHLRAWAFDDVQLPVPGGHALPRPSAVGIAVEALELQGNEKVLEVGTGTGYVTAVLAQLAGAVYSVEPHDQAAAAAATTLGRQGLDNVHLRHAEAAGGWMEQAPFDAILVQGNAPRVPPALQQQLAVGGRLVMPLGVDAEVLELVRMRRLSETEFRLEDLADIAAEPTPGTADEVHEHPGAVWSRRSPRQGADAALAGAIAAAGERFATAGSADLRPLLHRIGDARVVLLGAATHGTSDFLRMRARITRDLVREHGFTFVALEADWPDAARIDRHVRHAGEPDVPWTAIARFPVWMWCNQDMQQFVDGLRTHNSRARRPVAVHGLDMYSLYGSVRAVLRYLDQVDPATARVARQRYSCLTPWYGEPVRFGPAALAERHAGCEREVVAMLADLQQRAGESAGRGIEPLFDALQNARVVSTAERFYRTMYYGSRAAWNLRDRHMFDTLKSLLAFHGEGSRAVVWAHNAHAGDSAGTEMSLRGEFSLGHLCRAEFGPAACLVGMGTARGTVAAAAHWDGPTEAKVLRPSAPGSIEQLFHDTGVARFVLPLRTPPIDATLLRGLAEPRLQSAVGVVFAPEVGHGLHGFDAVLPRQFDEYIWFDETTAVVPLQTEPLDGMPDTYPFGV